jgi:hypothetical protein
MCSSSIASHFQTFSELDTNVLNICQGYKPFCDLSSAKERILKFVFDAITIITQDLKASVPDIWHFTNIIF